MLGIYTRLSRDERKGDEKVISIENQEELGILYAKDNNLKYQVYIDLGVSGTLPTHDRPDFENLLDDIEDGVITKVWVSRQDRLERNPEVWFFAIRIFKKHNVELIFGDKGVFDYNNADQMFMGSIQSIMNKRYVDTLASASKRQIKRNIEKGFAHGTPAYGYKKGDDRRLIIDEDEEKIVREIYALSLKGVGTTTIAKILNDRGEQTSYNKIGKGTYFHKDQFGKKTYFNKSDTNWKGNTIRHIIKNPLYKGERVWKGETYSVDRIVEPDYWELVNNNLKNNKNNKGKKVYHQYLLKGLLKCQNCGKNMNGKRRIDKSDNFYYCASKRVKSGGCGNRSINIDAIEGVVWSLFFKEGELINFLKSEIEKDDNVILEIERKIQFCQQTINRLISERKRLIKVARAGGIENDTDIVSELNSIKIEMKDEQHKIDDFNLQIANAKNSNQLLSNHKEDFETYTDKLSFLEKKEIVNKYIYQIRITSWKNDGNVNFRNVYSLIIKFRFKNEDEHFVFFRKENILFSVNRKSFIGSKHLGTSNKTFSEVDVMKLFSLCVFAPEIGYVYKPYKEHDGISTLLTHTIFPYGNVKDWNSKRIIKFYKKHPTLLDNETGLSKLSLIKDKEGIAKFRELRSSFEENENFDLEKWVEFLCKLQGVSISN